MKRYLLPAILLTVPVATRAQETLYLKNGATISVQSGAVLTVKGDVTVENGATLTNQGTIHIGSLAAPGTGHWTDHNTVPGTYGAGKLVFNGAGTQTIKTPHTLERIEVNTGALQLLGDVESKKWYLHRGIVHTGAYKVIVTEPAALAVEAAPGNPNYQIGWVHGTMRRYVTPATVNGYVFPVGANDRSNPALLNQLSAAPLTGITYIDMSHTPKQGTDAGLYVREGYPVYLSIAPEGVWNIMANANPTGGKFDLDLYFNGFSGLTDNHFGILQRPAGSANGADWVLPTGSTLPDPNTPGVTLADGYATRKGLTSFGQFGIGLTSSALPVTLVDFRARRLNATRVQLNWETATEQNNRGFEVERREQQTAFRTIGFVASLAAGGNSNQLLRYLYEDANPHKGITYYRLKQIDNDNRATYTLIKAVRGTHEGGVTVLLWPNPNKGQFSIRLDGGNEQKTAHITDLNGKVVQRIQLNHSSPATVSGLVAGAYIVTIPDAFGSGEHFQEKVIVIR